MKTYLPKLFSFRSSKKLLAIAIVLVLVANFVFIPNFLNITHAGTLTSAKVTISDSRAGASGITYAFAFTTTDTTDIKQLEIDFCTTSAGACTKPTGINIGTPTLSSDNLAGTGRTVTSQNTGRTIRVVVTTPAAQSTQAVTLTFTGLTNPTTTNTAFYPRITTWSDTGSTVIDGPTAVAAATLDTDSLAASASVDSYFSFSSAGKASGTAVAGNQTTNVTAADNTIPFGTLTANAAKTAAHDLTIATNATNGYTVTVKSSDPPLADGSKNIDKFSAGSNAAPAAWVANTTNNPTGTTPSVNTGFFGYTTNDSSLGTGTPDRFTTTNNFWAGSDLQTASEVAYNAGSTSGSGDTVRVGWRIEVNNYQPNGSYTGTVTLVATPTF